MFVAAALWNKLLAALFLLGVGALVLWRVYRDLRQGWLRPSIHDRVYSRKAEPWTYWSHVAVFAGVGLGTAITGVVLLVHTVAAAVAATW